MTIRRVESAADWEVVAWLWQAFRADMSEVVGGLPRADGRYSTRDLDPAPGSADHVGYVWWTENEHGRAPGAFAVVEGLTGQRRGIAGFWVARPLRRDGVGRRLALDVLVRHPSPWTIAFQHDNQGAGQFWRRIATEAFGDEGVAWTEAERPVSGKPDVPPDHWIETRV